MTTSLIYRNAMVYDLVMLALYGRHYAGRYRAVAELIPDGASVLEVCCGPGYLYERYLRDRGVRYHGGDINPKFVERIERLGGTGEVVDVARADALPRADFVVMQASLYHFLPDPGEVVEKMLAAATKSVIIAEPIRNLSTAGIPVLSRLARRHADPGSGKHQQRFTEESLERFMSKYGERVTRSFLIPGGREKVYVLANS